jgi:hypothetical protein
MPDVVREPPPFPFVGAVGGCAWLRPRVHCDQHHLAGWAVRLRATAGAIGIAVGPSRPGERAGQRLRGGGGHGRAPIADNAACRARC